VSTSRAPDDWRPRATREVLIRRARLLERLRAFFSARGVLEVETPALSRAATTDPHLASFTAAYHGPDPRTLYLHTSPEFPMKRLLAAGSGSIYQLCKVFRDAEAGRLHNPEFTLLEWYRVGFDADRLMDETAALIAEALAGSRALAAPEKLTYAQAFERYAGIDPFAADTAVFAACARRHGLRAPDGMPDDPDPWRDLLLTHVIEPQLGRGRVTLLYDYPASQAALARIRPGPPPVAERFEAYLDGIELANGFHELNDAAEQRARFERDRAKRTQQGLPAVPMDTRLLAALEAGLPDCAGVALGVDRLVMLAAGADSIQDVLAFPIERA
jgi:lysyl-tRNA synthetase class 2